MISDAAETPFVEVLYGSAARGDNDEFSDLDVLIVGSYEEKRAAFASASVVRYTWSEFSEMGSYGSLFLRHLRSEGIILNADDAGRIAYRQILNYLPCYQRASIDLKSFKLAIRDSELALIQGDSSLEFELASLATVMRHGSILGAYLMGSEIFSRTGAFDFCCDRLGLGDDAKKEFRRLYAYRIAIARDLPFGDSPTMAEVVESIRTARTILNGVRKYASRTAVS